ncbi:MAG: D-tyrosyl-tRNA(Tyr) deacylase [Alphaproteobacteria bacterium]|nr:D-tyrosyl-tRNA(Tyr) deacylase [Alphaproteobacteria bacterium]
MKALIQRVKYASVKVDGKTVGKIDKGLLVFLGVQKGDGQENAAFLSKKICNLRIFEDDNAKMNKSLFDVQGQMLIVSQFTLCADTSRGNRPGFEGAALPDEAKKLYEYFCACVGQTGMPIQKGVFGADMKVELLNDGPVTLMVEK